MDIDQALQDLPYHYKDLKKQTNNYKTWCHCWFEPTVCHYFSSNYVRLLAKTSLQVKTHNQNEWSVTNQIVYTGLRQDYYL